MIERNRVLENSGRREKKRERKKEQVEEDAENAKTVRNVSLTRLAKSLKESKKQATLLLKHNTKCHYVL